MFLSIFLIEFQKNKVLENQVSEKQVLEKLVFILEKNFCQNIVLIYLVLIYDHTLALQISRTLFCIYLSKENLLEKYWFQKDFQKQVLALSRSTGWSTAGRAKLLCRSTGRSTDMHQVQTCTSVDRLQEQCSLFGLVDRQRVSLSVKLSVWEPRSTVQSTAFPNGQKFDRWRSTDNRFFC